jgi:hypothetical protein
MAMAMAKKASSDPSGEAVEIPMVEENKDEEMNKRHRVLGASLILFGRWPKGNKK